MDYKQPNRRMLPLDNKASLPTPGTPWNRLSRLVPPTATGAASVGQKAADGQKRSMWEHTPVWPRYKFFTIVVPLDGTVFGEHALPLALSLARRAQARLRLVHVPPPLDAAWLKPSQAGTRRSKSGLAYLYGVMRRLAEVSTIPVTPTLLTGSNVAAEVSSSAAAAGDLVIMASHQRSLFQRLWHGSVTNHLLQTSEVPLLQVPGQYSAVDLRQEPSIRHLLLPLDGTAESERSLPPVIALGSLLGAEVSLLQIIAPQRWEEAGLRSDAFFPFQASKPPVPYTRARQYLHTLQQRLESCSVKVRQRIIMEKRTIARVIVQLAESTSVDLIALAAHERCGPLRLALGSVSASVLRRTSVPVLVVPPVR